MRYCFFLFIGGEISLSSIYMWSCLAFSPACSWYCIRCLVFVFHHHYRVFLSRSNGFTYYSYQNLLFENVLRIASDCLIHKEKVWRLQFYPMCFRYQLSNKTLFLSDCLGE